MMMVMVMMIIIKQLILQKCMMDNMSDFQTMTFSNSTFKLTKVQQFPPPSPPPISSTFKKTPRGPKTPTVRALFCVSLQFVLEMFLYV